MYQFQDSLPQQPLPQLQATCSRYLDRVKPLLNEAQLTSTTAAVTDFLQGDGPKLQKQLEMIAASTATSYINEFLDERFLDARLPLVKKTNIAQVLSSVSPQPTQSQTQRAATLIFNLLKFYWNIKHHALEPDRDLFQINRPPLCMVQYNHLFGRSRLPGLKRDSVVMAENPNHIIVIRHHQFYALKLIQAEQLPTLEDIQQQLDWIVEQRTPDAPGIGVLTTLPRTQWAVLRSYMTTFAPENAQSLEWLDQALFVVCLDETIPEDLTAALENAFYSNGKNRWFDKPIQLIVTANAQAAINIEHTGFDGYTVMRMTSTLNQPPDETGQTGIPLEPPIPLKWRLTPEIVAEIEQASADLQQLMGQNQTQVLEFTEFGADFLRQQTLNVDGIIQLAFQLAYTRLHDETVCVTESVHIRHFQQGRFEDVRTVTAESVEFIQAFIQAHSPEIQYSTLNAAIVAHLRRLLDCKQGQNVDDHLLALKSLAHSQGIIPEIFNDYAYTQVFTQPRIWTSSLAAGMGIAAFIFVPPPMKNGYGISYIIEPDQMIFCITSQLGQAEAYVQSLKLSLSELGNLLKTAKKST